MGESEVVSRAVTASSTSLPAQRVPWWLWLNVLSLDAPLVAVLWQAALARCYKIHLLPGCHLVLFIAVWLIYMLDRTLDSFSRVATTKLRTRHAFYRRNRWIFLALVLPVATALTVGLALTAIPSAVLWRGIALAVLVILYLLFFSPSGGKITRSLGFIGCAAMIATLWRLPFPHESKMFYTAALMLLAAASFLQRSGSRLLLPKELICGYLFAVGCSLNVGFATMDHQASPLSPEILLLALLFALNCIAISGYERETDAGFDRAAISQTWPGIMRAYPLLLLSAAVLAGFVLDPRSHPDLVLFVMALLFSIGLLAALHIFARRLRPDVSRVLADAALALPLVLMFLRF